MILSRLGKTERIIVWICAALAVLSRLALAFRSDARIATRPYIEDSFYAFSCARQLALGHGFSVDGVHATNGVQPLICLLYAPCFAFTTDRWMGLRLTFVVTALIAAAGLVLFAALVKQLSESALDRPVWQSPAVIAAATWLVSSQLFVHNTNGLETGLTAALILACLLYHPKLERTTSSLLPIGFGVLLGLAVLSRIDCALLVLGFVAVDLYRFKREALRSTILYGVTAILVSAPWWIYNYQNFGSLMPISGQSEGVGRTGLGHNLEQSVAALGDILTVFFYHPNYGVSLALHCAILGIMLFAWWLLIRHDPTTTSRVTYRVLPLLVFALGIFAYYNFSFAAPHFIARYLHPLRLCVLLLFCTLLPSALSRLRKTRNQWLLLGGGALVVLIFAVQRYSTNFTTNTISELYRAGVWAKIHPSSRFGMDQSGTAGFVADNVVNLDGKVNPDALRARLANARGEYLATQRFDYVMDWPEFASVLVQEAEKNGVHYRLIDSLDRVYIYARTQ